MGDANLICTRVSKDRIVAWFVVDGAGEEVFAYLPHVPGLNPYLLRVGDTVAGRLVPRGGRVELAAVTRQVDAAEFATRSDARAHRPSSM